MKYVVLFLYSICLNAQDHAWLMMSQVDNSDTLYIRLDSASKYIPLRYDLKSEDGTVQNSIHKLYSGKRNSNRVGVLFYYSDYKSDFANSVMYIKHDIAGDTIYGVNWGSYWSLYDSPKGTQPWILADASTVIVPHLDPTRTYIDYYSDDGKRYRYICDTSQIDIINKEKWQIHPLPPIGD